MKDILTKWDQSLSRAQCERIEQRISRRQFIFDSAKATAGLGMLPGLAFLAACDQQPMHQQQVLIEQSPWNSLAAVQQVLFPEDGDGPSAMDLNAVAYLKFVIDAADTDPEDRDFILKGIDWLNQLSQSEHQQDFIQLPDTQRPALIEKIAKSRSGERWLSILLLYIFEALLVDPVYGPNPNGIGWQWLGHQPGFPSPPAEKIYTELLKR